MLLLALNFVGEMESASQAIRSEYQDSARCSGAGRLLPLPSTWLTHNRGTTYILTHCGFYIVCMQVQPVRVIVRLPYNRPEQPPPDPAPVSH
jgi:hypothetical protein